MRCAVLRWCVTTVGYGAVLHRCVTAVHYGVLQHYVTTVHDGSALQYYVTVVRYTAVCYGALRCVTLVRYAVADDASYAVSCRPPSAAAKGTAASRRQLTAHSEKRVLSHKQGFLLTQQVFADTALFGC